MVQSSGAAVSIFYHEANIEGFVLQDIETDRKGATVKQTGFEYGPKSQIALTA